MNMKNGKMALNLRGKDGGFTLIELVIVIMILGILAAVALPKFADLTDNARIAAVQGVAGAVSGGSSINHAARITAIAVGAPTDAIAVASGSVCDFATINKFMAAPIDASKYTIAPSSTTGGTGLGADGNCAVGSNTNHMVVFCAITDVSQPSATATASVSCVK